MIDAAYKSGLDALLGSINKSTGIVHPSDLGKTIEVFGRLLKAGRAVNHPDEIGEYLRQQGLGEDEARDIQLVYESLHGHILGTGGPWFTNEFYDELMGR